MVACSADIVVALPGSWGTQSEICYALVYGRPVIDVGNWKMKGTVRAKTIKDFEVKFKKIVAQLRSEPCLNSPKLKQSDET
jgi:predicted Rossmann-fold nucleotide-binding protein